MKIKLVLILLFTFFFNLVNAQLADSLAKKVDIIFSEYANPNSPGCVLAILKDGKTIYKKGYGMSNLEYNTPIRSSSIFNIGSISKQFTAAAIVMLSLEGKLSLHDDIRKYIPELPDFGHTITLNHLMHHTSGLREIFGLLRLAGWREDDVLTQNDVLSLLQRQKNLNFFPGDEYQYCNTGYMLLAIAVERITGVLFRKYVDSVFFKPLGMNSTHIHDDYTEITPNRTSGYAKDKNGKWTISIGENNVYGASNLFTTVEDLSKWDENFYTGKVGGAAFINAMQRTDSLNDKTPQTYASGLNIFTYNGYRTVEHSGADFGYRSYFIRFPQQHFSIIVLANLANITAFSHAAKVVDLFLKDITKNDNPVNVKTNNKVLSQWAGDYFDPNTNAIAKLEFKDNKLFADYSPLEAMNDSLFIAANLLSIYSFSGDSSNAKFVLHEEGTQNETFLREKMISLDTSQLHFYEGEFYSTELDTRYKLSLKDGALFEKWPRWDEVKLTPFIKDIFTGNYTVNNTALINNTVLFSRDKENNISGFYLTAGRVRNLYFKKLIAK